MHFTKNDSSSVASAGVLSQLSKLLLIAIVYWAAIRLGLLLVARPEGIAAIWPASGVALAVLLLNQRQQWTKIVPVLLITNALSNYSGGNTVAVSFGFALANILESFAAAWIFTAFTKAPLSFTTTKEVLLLFAVAIFSNGLTAIFGALVPTLAFGAPFADTWRLWWAADGLGLILVTATIITWRNWNIDYKSLSLLQIVEALLFLLVLFVCTWLLFAPETALGQSVLRPYLLFPLLIWLAFRFSQQFTATALLLLAVETIWFSLQGSNPFNLPAPTLVNRLTAIQIFLSVLAFTGFFLNALMGERQQAVKTLTESEERFRKLFKEHSAVKLIIDPASFRILDANEAAARYYGWSIAELQQMQIDQINTLPTDAIKHQLQKADSPDGARFEFCHRLANGSLRDVEVFSNSITTSGKTVLFSIIHDITERKKAKESLRESEQLLKLVLAHLPVGVWILNDKGEILSGNLAAQQIWGETRLVGIDQYSEYRGWWAESKKPIQPDEWSVVRAIKKGETSLDELIEIENFVGERKIILNSALPLRDNHGVIKGAIVLNQDITKRKRLEEERVKLEALNWQLQKNESLGLMAGSIAHHFNNQLAAIIGNLELAIDDLPLGRTPVKFLNAALGAAGKAAEVSGQMLAYLGQTTGKLSSLDLSLTYEACLSIFQSKTANTSVITADLPIPGPVVFANTNQVQQVLLNLLTNAWEASAACHGTVHLTVKIVTLNDIPANNRFPVDWQGMDQLYACTEVQDSGCGVPQHNIIKLFDPFYSSKFTGRGLGLPVALGIVKSYNGAICVVSTEGQGSTFSVYLPIAKQEMVHAAKIQPDCSEVRLEDKTILLVEDNTMMRDMAKSMLIHFGCKVFTARDGIEAVEVFQKFANEIHVVLCDVSMPRMNGWETLAALRHIRSDIPVILNSGYDEDTATFDNQPDQPQAFLHKPYTLAALKTALAQAMTTQPQPPA